MEAKILKHKIEDCTGLIISNCLYKSGKNIPPQMFHVTVDMDSLSEYVKIEDVNAGKLEDYELIEVDIVVREKKVVEEEKPKKEYPVPAEEIRMVVDKRDLAFRSEFLRCKITGFVIGSKTCSMCNNFISAYEDHSNNTLLIVCREVYEACGKEVTGKELAAKKIIIARTI